MLCSCLFECKLKIFWSYCSLNLLLVYSISPKFIDQFGTNNSKLYQIFWCNLFLKIIIKKIIVFSILIASIIVIHFQFFVCILDYLLIEFVPITIMFEFKTPIAKPNSSKFHISQKSMPYFWIEFRTKSNHSLIFLRFSHKVFS